MSKNQLRNNTKKFKKEFAPSIIVYVGIEFEFEQYSIRWFTPTDYGFNDFKVCLN